MNNNVSHGDCNFFHGVSALHATDGYYSINRSSFFFLYSVVYVTVPNSTVAQQIARSSRYERDSTLEDKESLLVMKTKSAALDTLKAKVLSMHPSKIPEFIALPIESGSENYLNWIDKQVIS
uniref:Divalent-cation tolerance protein CutA n=1 Tax=Wuchereria bancrofti TaxID=6293 RepID=A0A1I8EII5_WUCBA